MKLLLFALNRLILLCQVSNLRHCRVLSPVILSMGPVGDNTGQKLKPEVDKVGSIIIANGLFLRIKVLITMDYSPKN